MTITFTNDSTLHDVTIAYAEQTMQHEKERGVFAPYYLNYVQNLFKSLDCSCVDTSEQFEKDMLAEEEFLKNYEKGNELLPKSARSLRGNNTIGDCYRTIQRGLKAGLNPLEFESVRALKAATAKATEEAKEKELEEARFKEAQQKALESVAMEGVDINTIEGKAKLEQLTNELLEKAAKKREEVAGSQKQAQDMKVAKAILDKLDSAAIKELVKDRGIDTIGEQSKPDDDFDEFDLKGVELAEKLRDYYITKAEELGNEETAMAQVLQSVDSYFQKLDKKLSSAKDALLAKLMKKAG